MADAQLGEPDTAGWRGGRTLTEGLIEIIELKTMEFKNSLIPFKIHVEIVGFYVVCQCMRKTEVSQLFLR